MKRNFMRWLAASVVLAAVFGCIYATGQFIVRSGADDPQIQIAEDLAVRIEGGVKPEEIKLQPVDVGRSLATFLIVYDKDGNELMSSARLDGATPKLPKGVLLHATPQNSVTWEPKRGVRIAAVAQGYKSGYVVAGRSMREVEKRELRLLVITGAAAAAAELVLTAYLLLTCATKFSKNKK